MTVHTLVHSSDSFSCNCNSLSSPLSIVIQEQFSHFSSTVAIVHKPVYFPYILIFNFVQQCIQISTRINSSIYIHTSVFVSFKTYPIFNNLYHCLPVCLFTSMFIYLYVCLSVSLFTGMFVYLYVCLPVCLFTCFGIISTTCVQMHVRECDGRVAGLYDSLSRISCCSKCAS